MLLDFDRKTTTIRSTIKDKQQAWDYESKCLGITLGSIQDNEEAAKLWSLPDDQTHHNNFSVYNEQLYYFRFASMDAVAFQQRPYRLQYTVESLNGNRIPWEWRDRNGGVWKISTVNSG